ncbi:MAG: hypothetical protein ACI89Z_001442 [Porticoccus sp.]
MSAIVRRVFRCIRGDFFTNDNSKQKNLVRYILRKFTEHNGYKYSFYFDQPTIEHFYPQSKISDEWPDEIVGSLGNLFYLEEKHNGKFSVKIPSDKRKYIKDNRLSAPKVIKTSKTWTPEQVQKHTRQMAEEAWQTIWKI